MNDFIVISIKPEFSAKIFGGSKTIELRKSAPKFSKSSRIIIYSTYPEKAVIGYCKIERIITSTPDEIWENHSEKLGIDKTRFDEYYQNSDKAIGIVLTNIVKLDTIIPLKSIREHLPIFQPPQTFRYLNLDQVNSVYTKIAS